MSTYGDRTLAYSGAKVQSHFYPGDLVTRTGNREIRSLSGRLPDYPGELACMLLTRRVLSLSGKWSQGKQEGSVSPCSGLHFGSSWLFQKYGFSLIHQDAFDSNPTKLIILDGEGFQDRQVMQQKFCKQTIKKLNYLMISSAMFQEMKINHFIICASIFLLINVNKDCDQ